MRGKVLTIFFFFFISTSGQEYDINVTEPTLRLIKLCDVCTCSEIPDFDGTDLVFNIQCSEVDKIEKLSDLDKIAWPPNPNGLKISATFEGLGLSTLGKLPPNSQVETLVFRNNAIKTYWPDPFSDVPGLKKLSFYQNDLTAITPDLFTKIESLEDLDISYNKISDFNPLDFKHLHRLKRLSLQSNQLKKIPIEALQPLKSLEDLELNKNGIYDVLLPKDSPAWSGIKRLYLSGNKIRSITKDSFPPNNSLELLDLSNNIIELVEEDSLLSCTNLKELNLGQNNITFIFALPPSLQIAILKINTLYHWPSFPSGIKYIDLSYNRLSDLYDEKNVNFDSVEVLNIGGNQIKELNIEKKLPKLFILDLSYNLITEIPKCLNSQYLPNLEELHLEGNNIANIYFTNILALRNLYLNDLQSLVNVDEKAFSNVIGRSEESQDEAGCFNLYLSNCPYLSEIKNGAFDGTSLCMLDISKNNLSFLSRDLIDWTVATEGVNLQFNPWRCTCEMQWLVDDLLPFMYHTNNSRLLADLRCGSPAAFEGLRIVHWYNWTEQVMCNDAYWQSGSRGTYMMEPSSESNQPKVTNLTLILAACIIISLLIAIALTVYLVKTRKKYKIRQAAMKRKRQSVNDIRHSNGFQKEQFSALNRA